MNLAVFPSNPPAPTPGSTIELTVEPVLLANPADLENPAGPGYLNQCRIAVAVRHRG